MPISFILRSRRRSYRGLPSRDVGSIRNVRIENVTGRAPDTGRVNPSAGILISGLPGHPVIDVLLRNIRLSLPGGATDAPKTVPLQEADYPEYSRLGALPAFGAFVRHARDVRFEDVQIEARQPDVRPEIVRDDAAVVGKNGRSVGETPASGTPLSPSSR
jgi:hypothetical protein